MLVSLPCVFFYENIKTLAEYCKLDSNLSFILQIVFKFPYDLFFIEKKEFYFETIKFKLHLIFI